MTARSIRFALVALLAAASPLAAQGRVEYRIAFPNRVHHEAEVSATFAGVPQGQPLAVRMSRTSPGRYALHEFAKNVYNVRAFDGAGRPLTLSRPNPHQWDVAGHDGTVRVTYTLFGDRADGTYTGIDATHAHLNMPATFAWARGLENAPIRVTFDRPAPGWRVATQLVPTADSSTFSAPNLQWFMDSPTEVSPFTLREWTVRTAGGDRRVRIALHHAGTDAEADAFAAQVRRVVDEQVALFGEFPLDHGVYTFLADFLPHVAGDGMEHRNSTVITIPGSIAAAGSDALGTFSHEFFHLWNVERIRPRSLEPFNFEEANMSGELWFAEGFTSYFDELFLRRAGLRTDAEYADAIAGTLNSVLPQPGRRYASAVEMSRQAPFVDAAASIDPTNRANTYVSYYPFGATIGLGLDLTLRSRFPNVSLDDYMRAMYTRFGRAQDSVRLAPRRPYTLADLRTTLGDVTGDRAFADDFFARYIEGREAVDYAALLARAGFLLGPANPNRAYLGGRLQLIGGRVVLPAGALVDGPLYRAGVSRGDRIVSLDGRPIATVAAVDSVLAAHRPGDVVAIEWEGRTGTRRASATLAADPTLAVQTFEAAGRPVSTEVRAFRARWLGSRVSR